MHKSGIFHYTLDIFERGKRQTEGCHGVFDATYFISWMWKILGLLNHRGINDAIILMNNTKFHNIFLKTHPREM